MRNKYPGTCYRCQQRVAIGAGFFERHQGGWRVQHADCAQRWKGKTPTVEEAAAARKEAQNARRP